MKKNILYIEFIIALLGFTLLRLWRANSLNAYIHPTTIWMVVITGVLLILLACYLSFKSHFHLHATRWQLVFMTFIVLLLAFGRIVPLSANAARQRQNASANPLASRQIPKLTGLSAHFSILEWLVAWDNNPNHAQYLNSPVEVSGFIFKDSSKTYVTRLLVTCCVVDAAPVQLELISNKPLPAENTWVDVKGKITDVSGKPAIKVEAIAPISQPSDPYVH